MDVTRRIGVLGGTFDPVHFGHLAAAQEVAAQLDLARVLFIPTYRQPLKPNEPGAPTTHRLAMLSLATKDNPLFEVSSAEIDRGGVSYTVETLRALKSGDSTAELWFILGMDALSDLARWRRPVEIFELAQIAAVYRAGWAKVDLERVYAIFPSARGRLESIAIPGLDISSTDLRERVKQGRPIRYLVPDGVEDYIRSNALYR